MTLVEIGIFSLALIQAIDGLSRYFYSKPPATVIAQSDSPKIYIVGVKNPKDPMSEAKLREILSDYNSSLRSSFEAKKLDEKVDKHQILQLVDGNWLHVGFRCEGHPDLIEAVSNPNLKVL
jgi:hypothetical protein